MKVLATGALMGILAVATGCSSMMDKTESAMSKMHKMELNDAQIVSVLNTANMGEITQGQIGIQRAMHPSVKAFAQKMINQHTANDQKTTAWAASAGITAQTNDISMKLKKESDDIVMKLNKEDAKDFDKTYIDCQVKVHKMVLKTIDDKLLPNAHSADLRNHLVATRAAVAGHLMEAEMVMKMMK